MPAGGFAHCFVDQGDGGDKIADHLVADGAGQACPRPGLGEQAQHRRPARERTPESGLEGCEVGQDFAGNLVTLYLDLTLFDK